MVHIIKNIGYLAKKSLVLDTLYFNSVIGFFWILQAFMVLPKKQLSKIHCLLQEWFFSGKSLPVFVRLFVI